MQSVKLNLTPTGVMPHLYCSRYDVGRKLDLVLYDGSEAYEVPAGATVVVHGYKPDGKIFTYGTNDSDSNISINGSQITISTTEQMTAVVGRTVMEVVIYGDARMTTTIGSLNFILEIEDNVLPDDDKTSESDLQAYERMVDAAKESKATAEDAISLMKVYGIHVKEMTLSKDLWTGDAAPYSYDIGSSFAGMGTIVALKGNATSAQLLSWRLAEVYGDVGTKLYARNTKPALDLPVLVVYAPVRKEETE